MKEPIIPQPCRRIWNGQQCGKLPTIIHPEPGLYYAVCSCPGHSAFEGYYQFMGTTPESALRQWNDWQLYGISRDEELIDRLCYYMGTSLEETEKKKRKVYERKNERYNKRHQKCAKVDNKFPYTLDDRGKERIDGIRLPHIYNVAKYER